MKISRIVDGKKIDFTLSSQELHEAYEEKDRLYEEDCLDVFLETEGENVLMSQEQKNEILEKYNTNERANSRWWLSMRKAVDDASVTSMPTFDFSITIGDRVCKEQITVKAEDETVAYNKIHGLISGYLSLLPVSVEYTVELNK